MDALEYSILRITRHTSKPLPKHEIYTAIQQQRDRLPICWAGRTSVESLISQGDMEWRRTGRAAEALLVGRR